MNNEKKKRLLLLCTGNSARSIMGEAIVRHLRWDEWEVQSAGTDPKGVHPMSIRALGEAGIDAAGLESKHLSMFQGREFELVVTLCDSAAKNCPFFPGGKEQVHLPFDDPAAEEGSEERILDKFRRVRDEMRSRLIELVDRY